MIKNLNSRIGKREIKESIKHRKLVEMLNNQDKEYKKIIAATQAAEKKRNYSPNSTFQSRPANTVLQNFRNVASGQSREVEDITSAFSQTVDMSTNIFLQPRQYEANATVSPPSSISHFNNQLSKEIDRTQTPEGLTKEAV